MPSSPQTVPTVILFDYLKDDANNALSGERVTVVLKSTSPVTSITPQVVLAQVQQSTITDGNGYWQFALIPNTNISPANTVYTVLTPTGSYDVTLGATGPYQSTAFGTLVNVPSALVAANTPGPVTISGNLTVTGNEALSGTLTAAGADLLTLRTKTRPLVDVTHPAFGAVADGVTDAGPAINAAIAYALTLSGAGVYIPAASLAYAIATTIVPKNEVTVIGDGVDATILKWTGTTNSFMISNGTGYTTVLSKFCLAEMTLDAGSISGTVPLALFASQKGHYRDLQIQNVAGAGTYAIRLEALSIIGQGGPLYDNCVLNDFKNVTIINAVRGINLTGNPAAAACTLNHFYDLAMYQIHDIGIRFVQTCDTNYFYGVIIIVDSNNATGLKINDGANRAIDNDAKIYSFFGMAMSADPPGKTGFTCFDLGWVTAVEVYNFYSDPSLTAATLVGGPSAPKGLVIYDTSQYPVILRMWDTQIVPNGKHAYGHTYQSIAWASPLSIDASVGQFVNVTGTVTSSFTINAPTNPLLGQILIIKLTKANDFNTYVITWNAVFKAAPQLGTDANIVQEFAWWYDGTGWQQLGGAFDQVGSAWFMGKVTTGSINNLGKVAVANGIVTAGLGYPAIYLAPAPLTGQTGAVASIATITSPNDGVKHTYMVSGFVTITTLGSGSFNLQVAYTDSNAGARTCNIPLAAQAGTFAALANTADDYKGTVEITVNPNTAVTIKTAGTFTGCTYNVGGNIKQVL